MNATMTLNYNGENQKRTNRFALLFLLVMLFSIPIIWHAHAMQRHGADARAVHRCMSERGPSIQWRLGNNYYFGCKLDDGRIGLHIAVKGADNNLWHEVTSFVKGHGTEQELFRYMERLGAEFVNNPFEMVVMK